MFTRFLNRRSVNAYLPPWQHSYVKKNIALAVSQPLNLMEALSSITSDQSGAEVGTNSPYSKTCRLSLRLLFSVLSPWKR